MLPCEISAFIEKFEACTLPKPEWTHRAHLVVAHWYLSHFAAEDALPIVRQRIRAYNEATGTPNTDSGGYHETLTRLFLSGVSAHLATQTTEPLANSLTTLLESPLADKDWPLQFYSRERLFSLEARRSWLKPDLNTPPWL